MEEDIIPDISISLVPKDVRSIRGDKIGVTKNIKWRLK
jgi:2-keto-4-pentenoate hydratase